ncbi:MAG: N-6 DNA methylase [Armatimonadota bacterium]
MDYAESKRLIDTARDVLVGKVPDPKSQIEQITIALIYKFMDDMDNQSVEMGGTRSFFDGEFRRFAWQELLSPQNGGQEMLLIYSEAISKMPENPGIPTLFREIFKNAYLPYRDPETLRLFLKTIDQFEYDHSENLGDAFEYLLSVMSSQGDAGQFRTPRHIIDFMVAVMNPQKHEQLMDPACGTAGFLISAYKHISRQNSRSFPLDMLSPEEHHRLMQGFTGYDISPDMVRLSLVNMYLHGFAEPHIYEYDTLTSEERWDKYADVILANPPFMSPKGGIRPHNRFSVKSNRSEVLFVDYIAEHLTANGRAAVIVPEGIIFQSQNAYKQLRQMLVESSLYAVVSLPSGVFAPYSGVKTSVLLMDKKLAKRCDSVLFLRISSDGFSIGAQRRETEKNDLPDAVKLIHDYQGAVNAGDTKRFLGLDLPCEALMVSKAELAEDGDYGLSMERYRAVLGKVQHKWPMVKLGDVCEISRGASPRPIQDYITDDEDGSNWIRIGDVAPNAMYIESTHQKINQAGASKSRAVFRGDFVLSNSMSFGRPYILKIDGYIHDGWLLLRIKQDMKREYLYHALSSVNVYKAFSSMATGGVVNNLNSEIVRNVQIPLPPLEVQREIVEEIEGYQRIIDGARQVVDNWKPRIDIDPSWPLVKLGEVCEIERGASPRPIKDFVTESEDGVNWVRIGDTSNGGMYIDSTKQKISSAGAAKSRAVVKGDFVLSNSMSFGRPYIMNIDGYVHDGWLILRPKLQPLVKEYLYYILSSDMIHDAFVKMATGGVVNNLNSEIVRNTYIPIPSEEVQMNIVRSLESERMQVEGCRELIAAYEARIKRVIDRVWEGA